MTTATNRKSESSVEALGTQVRDMVALAKHRLTLSQTFRLRHMDRAENHDVPVEVVLPRITTDVLHRTVIAALLSERLRWTSAMKIKAMPTMATVKSNRKNETNDESLDAKVSAKEDTREARRNHPRYLEDRDELA